MNECDHYRQLEEAADDGLPEFEDDIDLQEKWENMNAEEERKTISAIEDYMKSNCQKCSFGKGSQQCENCYVGGY